MTRALLVCPEPLGHHQPAGIGIRFLEMANVLLADGHEVMLLSPDAGSVAGCRAGEITPESLHRHTSEAEVAVVQGHAANDFFGHGFAHESPIPTVVDLYDPFIIENLHYYPAHGAEVFTHDHATLMQSLLRGDLFLCASEAQRLFYLGALLAAGRVNPIAFGNDPHFDKLIRIAPFGVPPPSSAGETPAVPGVLFGGIYDWYDPILAIDAVAIARASLPDVTLTFTTHPNPSLTPQGKLAEAIEHTKRKGYDFVRFEPWVAYEQRAAFYGRFGAALLTFPQSIETDLSMRTRIYDYLWGQLPIVTSSARGTDELLIRYGAGEIVHSASPEDFAKALVRVLGNERMREGARRFVDEHQWPHTLQPLVDFVRHPCADPRKDAFAASMHVPDRSRSFLDRIKRRMGGSS
ncbi:MAG TPA: glycosyltransferase family 4 protein [Thermoanaerobaculia bacterium]|jgi:glycosyltransferase involved in cell wall biosynthesis|nr:glycosyltransferase family 4 protein [Thermoanaerobaculia bacterium]